MVASVVTPEHAAAPLVDTPARQAVSYGLFSVLGFSTPALPYWQQGARWEEFLADSLGILGAPCPPPEAQVEKTFTEGLMTEEYASPFTLYGTYKCSLIGNDLSRAGEAATLRLQYLEERAVEAALWGTIGEMTPAFDTLSVLTTLGTTQGDLLEAVALLEQHIADEYGALGVLHMNRANGTRVHKAVGLEFRAGRAYTPLGTPVVIGQGYGSGAIVATGPMFGYRGDIVQPYTQNMAIPDTAQNDVYALAERTYLVGYEQAPATQITLTPSTP